MPTTSSAISSPAPAAGRCRAERAAIQHGDESHAGSPSWLRLRAAVQEHLAFRQMIPTHQRPAAERLLFSGHRGAPGHRAVTPGHREGPPRSRTVSMGTWRWGGAGGSTSTTLSGQGSGERLGRTLHSSQARRRVAETDPMAT
ncbi:MAG: beta-eliminating lyase-related protein [Candidatus Dormibacteria bacterium]